MLGQDAALTACDLEPIHIPGSIQPYGVMLVADPTSGEIVGYAGDATYLEALLGTDVDQVIAQDHRTVAAGLPNTGIQVLGEVTLGGSRQDAVAYRSGGYLVFEFTPRFDDAAIDAAFLGQLESLEQRLERAASLEDLSNEAARIFQRLTGYSRVMVYRFVDDDAGVVLGEAISDDSPSFMRHHFPASDIPRQARALYVRNKVRVIADVHYQPSPIVSASSSLKELDLSDSTLRSVSPVHIQYLKNMGVAASASMSIVKDGVLWGLIACHHHSTRPLSLSTRIACQAMATSLARIIKGREETELYRERIRLRGREDGIMARLGEDNTLGEFFARSGRDLADMLGADGFAAVQGEDLFTAGHCPDPAQIRAIADHVRLPALMRPWATRQLAKEFPPAQAFRESASGLLAVTMSTEVPTILMWFRAEQLQSVKWAGNPHKDVPHEPGAVLTPRASFEAWSESVHGRSDEWSIAQTESAARIVRMMLESRNTSRIRLLNREMTTTLRENETLIAQKDFLLREVNHRVQNSLQLVAAFLRMQGRNASAETRKALEEADGRLMAVALAHQRLHQDDSVEIIDLGRYLDELVNELLGSMDAKWRSVVRLDLAPVLVSTDRAVTVGLVLNELLTNVTKYAYDGQPGPATVKVEQHRNTMRIVVSDAGRGRGTEVSGTGFGTRMIGALVQRLEGTLEYEDNHPGTRATITAPVQTRNEAPTAG
jgi:light-regulated signal transduction histidine kinase (bacteriophytochrome)